MKSAKPKTDLIDLDLVRGKYIFNNYYFSIDMYNCI